MLGSQRKIVYNYIKIYNGGDNMQRRAIILYRVSTDRQELEAQKSKCRKFCKESEYELIDEIYEHGVSGYKKSLKDRKGIVELIARAENNEYDVLIVFMFDRLGRREDETPILIQQLSKNNVDIYIASTGEKIESSSHTDKFMNYVHSWVAEFESIKTSERVKNAISSKNTNGEYTGGTTPYGYELYLTGEIKENGKAKHNIRINEEEAKIVRLIFDLVTKENFGGGKIASYLNNNGYKNRGRVINKKGKEMSSTLFRSNSINRLIKNSIYIGRQRYNVTNEGEERSERGLNTSENWRYKPYNPDLRIISDETFYKANEMSKKRTTIKNKDVDQPRNGKLLLSGLSYCGKCGGKLKSDYSVKNYKRKTDGKITKTYTSRYSCNMGRELGESHGKRHYSSIKYDKKVQQVIFDFIGSIDTKKFNKEIQKFKDSSVVKIKENIEKLEEDKKQSHKAIEKYEVEVEKCLMEDDSVKMNILIKGIKRNEEKLVGIRNEIENLKQQLDNNRIEMADLEKTQNELVDWKKIYNESEMGRKKMMIMELTEKIVFHEDGIEVKFKLPLENSQKIIQLPTTKSEGEFNPNASYMLRDNDETTEENVAYLQPHAGRYGTDDTQRYTYIIVESKFSESA